MLTIWLIKKGRAISLDRGSIKPKELSKTAVFSSQLTTYLFTNVLNHLIGKIFGGHQSAENMACCRRNKDFRSD